MTQDPIPTKITVADVRAAAAAARAEATCLDCGSADAGHACPAALPALADPDVPVPAVSDDAIVAIVDAGKTGEP